MEAAVQFVTSALVESGIAVADVEQRSFPEELWLIVRVPESSLLAAQSLSSDLERKLNGSDEFVGDVPSSWVVTFRPQIDEIGPNDAPQPRGKLFAREVDQLVQLLEARSRTSDALPSLNYVEDPRASLSAIGASRHHFIFGRRGVGKTALMLEAKRNAEKHGHVTVWFNAHVVRGLSPEGAFCVIAEAALTALVRSAGTSEAPSIARLTSLAQDLADLRARESVTRTDVARRTSDLNQALKAVLRDGLFRVYLYLDDFYLLNINEQPVLLDYLAGMLRDCDGWLKIASIERLTKPYEPSSRAGLEVPHDASVIDIDVTLEDPGAAQGFLESVLANYTTAAGIARPTYIAKPQAMGRLVLASGGVPRDYLNLFAASVVVARGRGDAREIGKEDVAVAAGTAARGKKRDLEQDVASESAPVLLRGLNQISRIVKGAKYTYFLVNFDQKSSEGYEILGQLVDLRFAHLVQASLSDQHRPGTRYEGYVLDLSEFADVRLQRGLNVLDLEAGRWNYRLTGQGGTSRQLTATQLRDRFRKAPVVDLVGLGEVDPAG